jgi:hypothetical protein
MNRNGAFPSFTENIAMDDSADADDQNDLMLD